MWDNRESKRNPKAPDFKCKNKECVDERGFASALWEKDVKAKGVVRAPAPERQSFSSGGPLPYETDEPPYALAETGGPPAAAPNLDPLFTLYDLCFDHAHSLAERKLGADASHEGISAMAATLFIAASRP